VVSAKLLSPKGFDGLNHTFLSLSAASDGSMSSNSLMLLGLSKSMRSNFYVA
jgi:hypothetical protein